MALMEWRESYSVGIPSIDEQHKKLVSLINELAEAMHNKKGKEVLKGIIDEMAKYAVYHFQTEEKYMKEFDFPGYDEHKKEHDSFVEKVKEFQKEYEEGKSLLTVEILMFLRDWLIKHILGTDKKYGPFLIEHGVR